MLAIRPFDDGVALSPEGIPRGLHRRASRGHEIGKHRVDRSAISAVERERHPLSARSFPLGVETLHHSDFVERKPRSTGQRALEVRMVGRRVGKGKTEAPVEGDASREVRRNEPNHVEARNHGNGLEHPDQQVPRALVDCPGPRFRLDFALPTERLERNPGSGVVGGAVRSWYEERQKLSSSNEPAQSARTPKKIGARSRDEGEHDHELSLIHI